MSRPTAQSQHSFVQDAAENRMAKPLLLWGVQDMGEGRAHRTLLSKRCCWTWLWDDNHEDLHGVKMVASDAKGCSMEAGFQEMAKRQQSSFSPPFLNPTAIIPNRTVLFYKVNWLIPLLKCVKRLLFPICVQNSNSNGQSRHGYNLKRLFLKIKRTSKDWVLYAL